MERKFWHPLGPRKEVLKEHLIEFRVPTGITESLLSRNTGSQTGLGPQGVNAKDENTLQLWLEEHVLKAKLQDK